MSVPFSFLHSFNLDDREIVIYKICLQSDPLTPAEIASHTGIKRPTVYVLLERMKEKGFIKEDTSKSTKHYTAVSPRDVLKTLEQQRGSFEKRIAQWEEGIPELEAIEKKDFEAPLTKLFKGEESMFRAYEEALKDNVWRGITNVDNVAAYFEEYLWKIGEALQKYTGPDARDILVDCPIGREYKQRYETEHYQIRLLPPDQVIMADTLILEEKFFLLSFEQHELFVLDIESTALTQSQMVLFDALWNSLEK